MTDTTNHRTRWTAAEVAFLEESWDGRQGTLEVIAELLGRTVDACRQRHYEESWNTAAAPVRQKPVARQLREAPMSNIVWDAENGWHDGKKVTVTLDEHGRITTRPILWTAEQICGECGYGQFVNRGTLAAPVAECWACGHQHDMSPHLLDEGERFVWGNTGHGVTLHVTAYDTTEED